MVLALASGINYEPKGCDDPWYNSAIPTAEINNISSLTLQVYGEENEEAPFVLIDIHWSINTCLPTPECPNNCLFTTNFRTESGIADANGQYVSTDVPWTSEDERDRLIAYIYIRDDTGKYVYKRAHYTFKPYEQSDYMIIYLLNNNSL